MKQTLLIFLIAGLITSCNSQPSSITDNHVIKSNPNSFAVVELFTSQGCSSCPPADALLGREIAAASKLGIRLIALSFHVDYWNRLGWADPYSQHSFTERQYAYATNMKLKGVYTPQAVVNGKWVTVGGNQRKLESFIEQSIAERPAATLTIEGIEAKNNTLEVKYRYKGNAATLNMAIVQHAITTPVRAGENGGRTITNYNVVKSWKTIAAEEGSNVAAIGLPVGYNANDYSIILYSQEKGYNSITAADMQ